MGADEEGAERPDDGFDLEEIADGLGVTLPETAADAGTEDAPEKDPKDEPEADADDEEAGADKDAGAAEDDSEDDPEETAGEESEEEARKGDRVQKRIDRLVAEGHELREERESLKAELEGLRKQVETKPPVVTVDPDNPLGSLTDAAAVEAEIAKAQSVLDWTEEHREGGTVTVNGEAKEYDADAVREIRSRAREVLRMGPKQLEYVRLREATLPEARAFYPDFFKPGTKGAEFVAATVKQYPWITRHPGWELVLGDAFVGQQMRLAKAEAMQRKASAPVKAKKDERVVKPPVPSARPKAEGGAEARLRQKAERVFKSGGDSDAIAEYVEEFV